VRRVLPWSAALLGGALVAGGVILFALANRSPADFGWAAYSPLSSTVYRSESTLNFDDGSAVLWTGQHLLGAGLVVAGLLVLAGVVGWLLGRRSVRRPSAAA
jgi:heme/copper-type cytochrome/quinol oxidase subunit 1